VREVAHNWVLVDVAELLSMSPSCVVYVVGLSSIVVEVGLWAMEVSSISLGGRRCSWILVNVVGFSSMSLCSRRYRCTIHVDQWLLLSLTGFAVDGLDSSSIRCVLVILQGVAHFRVVLSLQFVGC